VPPPLRGQRERIATRERSESRVNARVFPDLAPVTFRRWWLRAVKDAHLPALRPHDLRRSFVRNAIRSGVSEGVTMALVGHRTRSMFDRYNITAAADLVEGVARLDSFLAGSTTDTQTDTRPESR